MSMLTVYVFSSADCWENLPASAPTSMIVSACVKSIELWIKLVSVSVRYLPMRVFAAFSQWVSSGVVCAKRFHWHRFI